MRQSIRAAPTRRPRTSPSSAAPGTRPRSTELGPAAPDQRTLEGPAQGQGRGDLGAVDLRAARARVAATAPGVDSPAWYDQLFDEADDPDRALAQPRRRAAARRRASTRPPPRSSTRRGWRVSLAGIRDRPLAGLDELLDATRAVLCHGTDVPLALVRAELVVGHRLGEVPEDTPMVPLQQDVSRLQRRLRMKPEAQVKELTLDLRRENDRERSRLLHRLNLLEVPVGVAGREPRAGDVQGGVPARVVPGARARADPRGPLGHHRRTPRRRRGSRRARARRRASARWPRSPTPSCSPTCPDALEAVLRRARRPRRARPRHRRPDDRRPAAGGHPALRRRARQRHARRSPRCCAGSSCASRSACPARASAPTRRPARGSATAVDGVNAALALLQDDELTRAWREALRRVAEGERLPGTLAGRATRLLHDAGELEPVRADVARAQPGRGPRARRELDRGLHRHERPRARPRPRAARRARRLGRDACSRTPSPTSSRSCAAPSPSSPRASAAASANASAQPEGDRPLNVERDSTPSARGPRWRPSRGCSVAERAAQAVAARARRRGGRGDGRGARARRTAAIDGALDAVYGERRGDLSESAPVVARWLGELRSHFPSGVVRVVQQDAIDRLGIAPAAAGARGAGERHARRPPRRDADEPARRAARGQPAGRAQRRPAGRARTSSGGSPTARAPRRAARWTAARAPRARATRRSTGTARSAPTCATTSPSTGR